MKNDDVDLVRRTCEGSQAAFQLLVEQMGERDSVAIVVYAGAAGLVLPSTSGEEKDTILDRATALKADGKTSLAAPMEAALEVLGASSAKKTAVVMLSDGEPTVA